MGITTFPRTQRGGCAEAPASYPPPRCDLPRPFLPIDSVETPEGRLELRRRGEQDFIILIDGRVLMSSAIHRTEDAVALFGCEGLERSPRPRVLIGGLGLGYTLRAALDALPPTAEVTVAELNAPVVQWCRGPVGPAIGHALEDARVKIVVDDVMNVIRGAAARPFDAIIVDLYEGPRLLPKKTKDPLYGWEALQSVRAALVRGGRYAVWSEEPFLPFEERLQRASFDVKRERVGRGGPRHAVYVATRR